MVTLPSLVTNYHGNTALQPIKMKDFMDSIKLFLRANLLLMVSFMQRGQDLDVFKGEGKWHLRAFSEYKKYMYKKTVKVEQFT